MLAKGLAAQGAKGLDYFDLSGDRLDVSTFDLFCEFNNDEEVYQAVSERLDQSIDFFGTKIALHDSVVADGQFRSHLLSKSFNMSKVSEDISRIATELVEVTSLMSEKQARLDVQLEIAQSEAAKSVDLSDTNRFQNEHAGMIRFWAAAIMLGSAAEKMSDTAKLSLISKLLTLASLICTDLLTLYAKFDVEKTVSEVMSQVEANKAVTFDTPESQKEFREFVELNVEVWQFNLAAGPLVGLLGFLCEAGRTNVLLSPIERTKTVHRLEEFFRSTWAFDLDPVGKRRLPKELSKRLGPSPFLRTIFGISMVNRSYWFHHGRQRKEAVANGIDEMFKALSLKSNVDLDETSVS